MSLKEIAAAVFLCAAVPFAIIVGGWGGIVFIKWIMQ